MIRGVKDGDIWLALESLGPLGQKYNSSSDYIWLKRGTKCHCSPFSNSTSQQSSIHYLWMICLLKLVILHCNVCLPEGTPFSRENNSYNSWDGIHSGMNACWIWFSKFFHLGKYALNVGILRHVRSSIAPEAQHLRWWGNQEWTSYKVVPHSSLSWCKQVL